MARRTFQAGHLPDLRRDPEHGDGWVRFAQTVGGRTGLPAPRRVAHPPFLQWAAPTVWTTLSLTLHADGRAEIGVPGASRFPRHWVYDSDGKLARKSGLTDYNEWFRKSFGKHTPWGDEDSSALVVAVETALERELSVQLMHGAGKPRVISHPAGATLVRQGAPGGDVYLILDGVIRVERNGEPLAEYGPGAMLGERAHLEAACGPRAWWRSRRARWPRSTGPRWSARRSSSCPGCTGGKRPDPVLITFCGVRGSTPAPGAPYVRYGGNTSCVAVAHDGEPGPVLAARRGNRAGQRDQPARRRGVPGHDPAVPPALGPLPGAAVLPRRRPRRRAGPAAPAGPGRARPGRHRPRRTGRRRPRVG